MKLTKSKLKQIIKEELENILVEEEDYPRPALSYFKAMKRAPDLLNEMATLWDAILDPTQELDSLRDQAKNLGLAGSLATWHARKIDSSIKYPTGEELKKAAEEAREKAAETERNRPPAPQSDIGDELAAYLRDPKGFTRGT